VSQTKFDAGIVALLKDVVETPDVVLVHVIPLVTTSVPEADRSEPYRIENVTLGDVPLTILKIFVIVNCFDV